MDGETHDTDCLSRWLSRDCQGEKRYTQGTFWILDPASQTYSLRLVLDECGLRCAEGAGYTGAQALRLTLAELMAAGVLAAIPVRADGELLGYNLLRTCSAISHNIRVAAGDGDTLRRDEP